MGMGSECGGCMEGSAGLQAGVNSRVFLSVAVLAQWNGSSKSQLICSVCAGSWGRERKRERKRERERERKRGRERESERAREGERE